MTKVISWLMGVSAGFVLFTIVIQMIGGMVTGQPFYSMDWTGSMFIGGILALIGGSYESVS